MLSSFHQAISSQNWDEALTHILFKNCDPNKKGDNGLSAKELARDKINQVSEIKAVWGTMSSTISVTPLEKDLQLQSRFGVRGAGKDYAKALIDLGADINLKNKDGDNALMFYLKSVAHPGHNRKDKHWPSLEIIRFLISKGSDFTPNSKQENPLDFAKEKFGEPLLQYMKNAIPKDPKTSIAIKIQRAWRHKQYRKQNQKFFDGKNSYGPIATNEIEEKFLLHPKLSLQPKIPVSDNSIDIAKANEWINLHEEKDRLIAKNVLERIDHVSFERFLFGLKKSIEKWNELIMSRPESQRKYAILIEDTQAPKSMSWVTSLALPFLAHPPSQILTLDKDKSIDKDIHHLLFIDDAVYTGNQITRTLDQFLKYRIFPQFQHYLNAEWHVIIPFVSEIGKERLSEREVNLIHHETIPNFEADGLELKGKTATYFDHKIAEKGYSTIEVMTTGETIRGKPGVRFIPVTVEPYKN